MRTRYMPDAKTPVLCTKISNKNIVLGYKGVIFFFLWDLGYPTILWRIFAQQFNKNGW